MGKHAQYNKVAPAIQYGAEGSVLQNLPSRVHPAENLLKQAVWWIDAAHSTSSGQSIRNLGWGGAALDAQAGSTGSADSNDPKYLDWQGENYVYLPGVSGNYLSVPDEDALDITGDIDIRVKVALDDWTPAGESVLASKSTGSGNQQSWYFSVLPAGTLAMRWSTDGATLQAQVASSVGTGVADGATKWVRVTVDVDNGASGRDVKFWTSDDGASWVQLGTTQTTAGTTSIFASTAVMEIGSRNAGTTSLLAGSVYRAIVKNGIDGPTVLDVDCSQITSGSATSFTARTGQTVTINRATSGRKSVAVTQPVWAFGTDDYLTVSDDNLLDMTAAQDFSVLAVTRRWATGLNGGVIGKRSSAAATSVGWLVYSSATDAGIEISDGVTEAAANAVYPAPSGLNVLTATRSGTSMALYSSSTAGATVSTGAVGDLSNTTNLRVGQYSGGGASNDFEGIAFAVFRRALTASEIALLNDYYQARAE